MNPSNQNQNTDQQQALSNVHSSEHKNPLGGKGGGTAFMAWTPFNQRIQQQQVTSQQLAHSSITTEGASKGATNSQGFVRNVNSSEMLVPPHSQQGLLQQFHNSLMAQDQRKQSFDSELSDSLSDSSLRKKLQGL